jgi:Acetyltransferase (GNAT) domain
LVKADVAVGRWLLAALALQPETVFVLDGDGRILRSRAPDAKPGPRMYFAGCDEGNVIRLRHDVGDAVATEIARLAAEEPPFRDAGIPPIHMQRYVDLLATDASVEHAELGWVWAFPRKLRLAGAAVLHSGSAAGDRLLAAINEGGMPPSLGALGFVDLGEFWEPWCVSLEGGEIASIAFTPGHGERSAEVGVATVPAFRGRGHAAAAVAGWARHPALKGRTLFYSTSAGNRSSQRVRERLGLELLGGSLWVG